MNKPVMGAPRRRTDVFADLQRASEAISEAPETPAANPAPAAEPTAAHTDTPPATEVVRADAPRHGTLDLNAIRSMKVRKEPTVQTNARLPVSLIDDIDLIRSLVGTSATDIITEGTRREVARLKKLHGLE
jgi:hypothetical protein